MGSGRCGTLSLAALLNAQSNACCFHEANPSCMAWEGTEGTICSLLRDFEAIQSGDARCVTVDHVTANRRKPLERLKSLAAVHLIGDVASYYLPYVDFILEHQPDARFVCLKRDRQQTIDSFVRKLEGKTTKKGFWNKSDRKSRNHWLSQPTKGWARDNLWDRCFPSYALEPSAGLIDYVSRYYDEYYDTAEELQEKHPKHFRVFDMLSLNSDAGQLEILEHCYPGGVHSCVSVHENVGQAPSG